VQDVLFCEAAERRRSLEASGGGLRERPREVAAGGAAMWKPLEGDVTPCEDPFALRTRGPVSPCGAGAMFLGRDPER
jgi:hypothetical protein